MLFHSSSQSENLAARNQQTQHYFPLPIFQPLYPQFNLMPMQPYLQINPILYQLQNYQNQFWRPYYYRGQVLPLGGNPYNFAQQTPPEIQTEPKIKIEEIQHLQSQNADSEDKNREENNNFSLNRASLKIRQDSYKRSLARRNIKINFFTGLTHFIKSRITSFKLKGSSQLQIRKIRKLLYFLRENEKQFRTLNGWKNMIQHQRNGQSLAKFCKEFFGKSFAISYILNSKIQSNYKILYYRSITKFLKAAQNPELFNVAYFKPTETALY